MEHLALESEPAGFSLYLSSGSGASEGDFGHQRVCTEDLSNSWGTVPRTGHHVEHSGGDPSLCSQLLKIGGVNPNPPLHPVNVTPCSMEVERQTSARARAERGVSSAGFTTTVQPAARAAPTFLVIMALGKFHCRES